LTLPLPTTNNDDACMRLKPFHRSGFTVFSKTLYESFPNKWASFTSSPCPSDLLPMIVSPALHATFLWLARKHMVVARSSNNRNLNPEIGCPPRSLVMSSSSAASRGSLTQYLTVMSRHLFFMLSSDSFLPSGDKKEESPYRCSTYAFPANA
jgi:hypothetical protein